MFYFFSVARADPYCVLTFLNVTQVSCIIDQTLCPVWDETLLVENVLIPGEPARMLDSLPDIVLELFDQDVIVCVPFCSVPFRPALAIFLFRILLSKAHRTLYQLK